MRGEGKGGEGGRAVPCQRSEETNTAAHAPLTHRGEGMSERMREGGREGEPFLIKRQRKPILRLMPLEPIGRLWKEGREGMSGREVKRRREGKEEGREERTCIHLSPVHKYSVSPADVRTSTTKFCWLRVADAWS